MKIVSIQIKVSFTSNLKLDTSITSKYTFGSVQQSVTRDATYAEGINEQNLSVSLQQLKMITFLFIENNKQRIYSWLHFRQNAALTCLCQCLTGNFNSTSHTSLNALFTQVSEVIPNFKAEEITSYLNHGLKEKFVKGFGHENIHVQLGAYYASASIYKILGEAFIPRYLNEVDELQLNWFMKDISFPTPKQYIETHCKEFK
ncbi:MAG: hypothetical protein EXX96DRAFT_539149 [Benjaminiella poitrasii]|nr:MAG: hypothetical protein EXX96DRAFT_539149 [Benjaminiella poitrasii]